MMSVNYTCGDCRFYLPVDVFKGICKLSKEKVSQDKQSTENFQRNKKCKFCANFTSSDNNPYLGKCMKNYDAYPDMTAVTCDQFKAQ